MFYLMMHSTHFIYSYMASDIWQRTTTFVTPVVEHWLEREVAQWVHPMKDRSKDPLHHERTLLPQSYRITHTTTFVTPVMEHWLE